MPKPIKRRELIRRLRLFGWEGEYQEGKHPFLVKAGVRLTIQNPHSDDLDWTLVKRILKQAAIDPKALSRISGQALSSGTFLGRSRRTLSHSNRSCTKTKAGGFQESSCSCPITYTL